MYLFHHNILPNLFNQYFTSTKTVHKYNTRCTSYSNFYLHAINSNAAKKALQFSGAQIWNSLQPNWKDLSFPKFKEAIKADLILKLRRAGQRCFKLLALIGSQPDLQLCPTQSCRSEGLFGSGSGLKLTKILGLIRARKRPFCLRCTKI